MTHESAAGPGDLNQAGGISARVLKDALLMAPWHIMRPGRIANLIEEMQKCGLGGLDRLAGRPRKSGQCWDERAPRFVAHPSRTHGSKKCLSSRHCPLSRFGKARQSAFAFRVFNVMGMEDEKIKDLLDSIKNDYPIGSVIIWEPADEYPSVGLSVKTTARTSRDGAFWTASSD